MKKLSAVVLLLLFTLLMLPLFALAQTPPPGVPQPGPGEAVGWWDPVPNATAYYVQRAAGACAPSGLAFADVATVPGPAATPPGPANPFFHEKGLGEGKDLCWRVAAGNPATPGGRGPYSNLAGKQVAFTPITVAPQNHQVK